MLTHWLEPKMQKQITQPLTTRIDAGDVARWLGMALFLLLVIFSRAIFAAPLGNPLAQDNPAVADAPRADPNQEIVYLDKDGVIRVDDWVAAYPGPAVDWSSALDKNADGTVNGRDFRDFALGDVNNDGDLEIIGIKGDGNQNRIVIYDPVARGQAIEGNRKSPNGNPWNKLAELSLKGAPLLVAAGNYDPNLPGDEIVCVFALNDADKTNPADKVRVVIFKAATQPATGQAWVVQASRNFSQEWETLTTGNFDGAGADEIALLDKQENGGELNVFRVDNGFVRIGKKAGSIKQYWKHIAFGNWDGSGKKELLAVREGNGLPSFYVFQYNGDDQDFKELNTPEVIEPSPRFIFKGNINTTKGDEVFMLRNVPSDQSADRLLVRGHDPQSIPTNALEQPLDQNNLYRAGAAGDLDGDGRDEVVLVGENKLLVFEQPDASGKTTVRNLPTNGRRVVIGDLDRGGIDPGPQLGATPSKLALSVEAGGQSGYQGFQLNNVTFADAIPFTLTVDGAPAWLTLTSNSGRTPATVIYAANATQLAPGTYTTKIRVTSSNLAVVNQPLLIDVVLTVTPALVNPQPAGVAFIHTDCISPTQALSQTINLGGTPGVNYIATLTGQPALVAAQATLTGEVKTVYLRDNDMLVLQDEHGHEASVPLTGGFGVPTNPALVTWSSAIPWLMATSHSTRIPDTLTLTADPRVGGLTAFETAYLVIIADTHAGAPPNNVRLLPVSLLCARAQVRLPLVAR